MSLEFAEEQAYRFLKEAYGDNRYQVWRALRLNTDEEMATYCKDGSHSPFSIETLAAAFGRLRLANGAGLPFSQVRKLAAGRGPLRYRTLTTGQRLFLACVERLMVEQEEQHRMERESLQESHPDMYAVMREAFGTRDTPLETLTETAQRYDVDPGALRDRRREEQEARDANAEQARRDKQSKKKRPHLRPVK